MLTLRGHVARVGARKMELGMLDTPTAAEAMRNKGGCGAGRAVQAQAGGGEFMIPAKYFVIAGSAARKQ